MNITVGMRFFDNVNMEAFSVSNVYGESVVLSNIHGSFNTKTTYIRAFVARGDWSILPPR